MSDAPRILVPVADGNEEIEVVTIVDTLRRAACDVTVASVTGQRRIVCSRSVVLEADTLLSGLADAGWHAIVLPGGMPGAEHLRDCARLIDLLTAHDTGGGLLAAICAAPAVVLHHHGLLRGRHATCHPSFLDRLDPSSRRDQRVVCDGNLITSQGPGTALEFALALVEALCGADARRRVADPMLPALP